jgi:hypothetical protein
MSLLNDLWGRGALLCAEERRLVHSGELTRVLRGPAFDPLLRRGPIFTLDRVFPQFLP